MHQWDRGTNFAGLVIEAPLGQGGMSVLYRAIDPRLGRPVALKIISPEMSDDPAFRTRFAHEARSASAVEHPGIVPIYAFGEEHGCLYIAMRLIDGHDLSHIIAADGALAPARAVHLLGQVADALDAVHRARLVHRDVKPANVLVAGGGPPESPVETAYLTDFGLTRSERTSKVTKVGHFVGTIHYASPEQLRGGEVTAASDVYSFAAMTHECLTGTRPFEADSDTAVMYAHAFEVPPAVSSMKPELPAAVDDVVRTGLAKEPDDRFASCGALMAALGSALQPAVDPGTVIRHRGHTLTPASELASSHPTVIVPGPPPMSRPEAQPTIRSPARSILRSITITAAAALVVGAGVGFVRSTRSPDAASTIVPPASNSSTVTGTRPVFTPAAAPILVTGGTVTVAPGIDVWRKVELGGPSRADFITTISIRNTTSNTVQIDHVEVIDKDEVGRVEDIVFRAQVSTIEADPVVSWSTAIGPGATVELRYEHTVNPDIDRQWAVDAMNGRARAESAWLVRHPEISAATRVRA